MRDLDAIDRQLRDLGAPAGDRPALLARVLGTDRSRDRLERLLGDMSADGGIAPVVAADAPAVVAPVQGDDEGPDTEESELSDEAAMVADLPRDTVADRPPPPEDDYEPELAMDAEPSAPPSAPPESPGFAAMFDFTNPPPPRASDSGIAPALRGGAMSEPSAAVETRAPHEAPEPESPFDPPPRAPSQYPEPPDEETTARRSVPPPPAPAAAADDDSDAEEADFELLVDDEDIIEIDDAEIVDDE